MSDYVQELIEKYQLETQRELAAMLEISEPTVSAHMSGRAVSYSDKTACVIARKLGYDEDEVMMCAAMERAKDPHTRKIWERARRKLASVTA